MNSLAQDQLSEIKLRGYKSIKNCDLELKKLMFLLEVMELVNQILFQPNRQETTVTY